MEPVTERLNAQDDEDPPLERTNSYQNAVQHTRVSTVSETSFEDPPVRARSISLVVEEGPKESSTDSPGPVRSQAFSAAVAAIPAPAPVATVDVVVAVPAVAVVAPKAAVEPAPAPKTADVVASPKPESAPAPAAAAPAAPVEAAPTEKKKVAAIPDQIAQSDDHFLAFDALSERFPDSHINAAAPKESKGLTSEKAAELLAIHGRNALKPPKRDPLWLTFLKQFRDPFLILLIIAGILSFGLYGYDTTVKTNLYAAIALVLVVVLTALFTFVQEIKAANVLAKFANLLQATTLVFRNGTEQTMDAAELVVGDIVKIKGGDKVPADVRVIFSQGVKVDNSPLTGETKPISLNSNISQAGTHPTESLCLGFKGTSCVEGECLAIVIRTGDRTFIGQIATLTASSEAKKTTLQIELEHFIIFIAKLAIGMGAVSFAIAIGRQKGKKVLNNIINGFLIPIIANVPQGLPATVNSLLSITASRMAKQNVLVKKLDCVETLGCTSLICTDKTGTLTKNQMTVTEVWVDGKSLSDDFGNAFISKSAMRARNNPNAPIVRRIRTASESSESKDDDNISIASGVSRAGRNLHISEEAAVSYGHLTTFELLHRLGTVCNKAFMQKKQTPGSTTASNEIEYVGNASDVAILRFCHGLRSSATIRQSFPVDYEIPFNSTNKWMLTIIHNSSVDPVDGRRSYTVMMKGAPEVILARCSSFLKHGYERDIDEEFEDEFEDAYERFGNKGSRVIGVCQRTFVESQDAEFTEESDNYPTNDMCFVGLYSITDPPRDGVREAIEKCHSAGIRVFMVTGDHHLTAKAIAKQVGILREDQDDATDRYCVILGSQIESLTDEDWVEISKREGVVFARTTPQHKMQIVLHNQANGHIVAVTGDGVNDAPALKNAHIGVAMGLSGSDVAREAAAIILLDDNFASIVHGIEQGRVIFDNLKKTIAYTITHLTPEMFVFILNLYFALPAPMSTLQILSIDLATELAPAIALAYEGPESDIMKRKPRSTKIDRLVARPLLLYSYLWIGIIETILAMFAYFWVFANKGISPSQLWLTSDNHWATANNDPFYYGPGNSLNLTSDAQATLAFQAASSYYLVIVLGQGFHVFMCQTSRISWFKHNHDNTLIYFGVAVQLFLAMIFIYVPGVQSAMSSADVGYPGWVCLGIVGIVIWAFNEWRKWFMLKYPDSKFTREIRW